MSGPVTVVLLGEPVAWARARGGPSGTQHFTPPKQRNTMAALRIAAQQAMREHEEAVFDVPLRMDLRAEFPIPKSMTKRDRPLALVGAIRPGKRPDIDNLYKIVADALNTIVFRDDALIVDAALHKFYSEQPKIVVTVRPVTQFHPLSETIRNIPRDTLETLIDEAAGKPIASVIP